MSLSFRDSWWIFSWKQWSRPEFHFVPEKYRKRLTHLQGEEVACPAEDDELVYEPVDEPVDELGDEHVEEPVELQEEERPEQDLHAAEIMLRRVHANLGHPSKGLMLRRLRDIFIVPSVI